MKQEKRESERERESVCRGRGMKKWEQNEKRGREVEKEASGKERGGESL